MNRNVVTPQERFFAKVRKSDGCWEWMNSKNPRGYGHFRMDGKIQSAHRVSYYFARGVWPKLSILHNCDNRACVNPDHLREGTQKENVRDMHERGRARDNKGRANPRYKHGRYVKETA